MTTSNKGYATCHIVAEDGGNAVVFAPPHNVNR